MRPVGLRRDAGKEREQHDQDQGREPSSATARSGTARPDSPPGASGVPGAPNPGGARAGTPRCRARARPKATIAGAKRPSCSARPAAPARGSLGRRQVGEQAVAGIGEGREGVLLQPGQVGSSGRGVARRPAHVSRESRPGGPATQQREAVGRDDHGRLVSGQHPQALHQAHQGPGAPAGALQYAQHRPGARCHEGQHDRVVVEKRTAPHPGSSRRCSAAAPARRGRGQQGAAQRPQQQQRGTDAGHGQQVGEVGARSYQGDRRVEQPGRHRWVLEVAPLERVRPIELLDVVGVGYRLDQRGQGAPDQEDGDVKARTAGVADRTEARAEPGTAPWPGPPAPGAGCKATAAVPSAGTRTRVRGHGPRHGRQVSLEVLDLAHDRRAHRGLPHQCPASGTTV